MKGIIISIEIDMFVAQLSPARERIFESGFPYQSSMSVIMVTCSCAKSVVSSVEDKIVTK